MHLCYLPSHTPCWYELVVNVAYMRRRERVIHSQPIGEPTKNAPTHHYVYNTRPSR